MELNPKSSKCYSCQYGLCTLQQQAAYLDTNFPIDEDDDQEPVISWDNEEGEDSQKRIIETRVCSLCYWAPNNEKVASPLIMHAIVQDCSRYEKRN